MQANAAREIASVRARALGWAKGAAGVTAGTLGFGLIKGRTDVGELARVPAIVVGALLLAALFAGALAAYLFMRAAFGRAAPDRVASPETFVEAQHVEAARATGALRLGFVATAAAIVLLLSAVGLTWYGPGAADPQVLVHLTGGNSLCGRVEQVVDGRLLMRTNGSVVPVELKSVVALGAVDQCP